MEPGLFLLLYGGAMTIKCHEFFSCKKSNCIMFGEEEDRYCWEVEPALTPCINHITEGLLEMKNKLDFCENCLYYEHMNKNRK